MTLASEEVSLYDTLMWAEEQAQHLSSASQHHVLLYLTINAFRHANNPENAPVGQVMSGRSSVAQIALRTGLHIDTVKRVLRQLQEHAYILADMRPGVGQSTVEVFWAPQADDIRTEIRNGVRPLPKQFRTHRKNALPASRQRVGNVVGINSSIDVSCV